MTERTNRNSESGDVDSWDEDTQPKPTVIGIYGFSGSGKTYTLNKLKEIFRHEEYEFREGSDLLRANDLDQSREARRREYRERAIRSAATMARTEKVTIVVTGQFMTWEQGSATGDSIWTPADQETYTHIVYLNTPVSTINDHIENDIQRGERTAVHNRLTDWQETERKCLRSKCLKYGILFAVVSRPTPRGVAELLRGFVQYDEAENNRRALEAMEKFLIDDLTVSPDGFRDFKVAVVIDGDIPLVSPDLASLFWEVVYNQRCCPTLDLIDPLQRIFSGPLGYSDKAFYQVSLLYDEVDRHEHVCQEVVKSVRLYQEFKGFLRNCLSTELINEVKVVVITTALTSVWQKMLYRLPNSDRVAIIGNDPVANHYVVTPCVKESLVRSLVEKHEKIVWAFGDRDLNLGMMHVANHAIVVSGNRQSLDNPTKALIGAVNRFELEPHQICVPEHIQPLFDPNFRPVLQLSATTSSPAPGLGGQVKHASASILERIKSEIRPPVAELYMSRYIHFTKYSTARFLTIPARDARVVGPELRKVYRQIGWYLAYEVVVDIVGLGPLNRGESVIARRYGLKDEAQTAIIALMPRGEPTALGVNEAFPQASLLHARSADDIKSEDVNHRKMIILVDAVLGTRNSIIEFVDRIRPMNHEAQIIVMVGFVQDSDVSARNLATLLLRNKKLHVVALRNLNFEDESGRDRLDTINRLFNTNQLAQVDGDETGRRSIAMGPEH